MIAAYIGIGSNLVAPEQQARAAIRALAALPDTLLQRVSSLYRSAPMGPQDQPDYVNAVACLHTSLTPLQLLDQLQQIEQQQGRVRKAERWGPRTLDLDLLLYGDEIIDQPRLTVPHYGLTERAFVLYPLAEIAPELQLPGGMAVATLLASVSSDGLRKFASV